MGRKKRFDIQPAEVSCRCSPFATQGMERRTRQTTAIIKSPSIGGATVYGGNWQLASVPSTTYNDHPDWPAAVEGRKMELCDDQKNKKLNIISFRLLCLHLPAMTFLHARLPIHFFHFPAAGGRIAANDGHIPGTSSQINLKAHGWILKNVYSPS
jgi:hypothetical protein